MLALALALTLALELDDTWQGATPLQGFGCGVLAQSGDEDWWRLRRDHAASHQLYVDTGHGCLCACPHGDYFLASIEGYDATGALLFSHVAPGAGLAIFPLSGLPMGTPVWLKLSGVTVGAHGWSSYRLLVF